MIGVERDISANVRRVREAIAEAAERAGREPNEVTLVGISKMQRAAAVVEAVRAGVEHIGENRIQEAAPKVARIRELVAAESGLAQPIVHLVGHLQTNKAGLALQVFDRIDSVDSLKVAQALSRRLPPGRELPVLLEVYVGDDPARPGLRAAGLIEAVHQILEVPGLRVEGLMTVAPLGGDARAAFGQVRQMKLRLAEAFPRVHFGVLSMGMTDDFPDAIAQGATEIRVGSGLFGPRTAR